MTHLKAWFDGRSLRERRLVLAMLALAAVTLVWGGVVLPVRDALASVRTRHDDAIDRLGATLVRVDAVRSVPARRAFTGDLAAVVRDEAAEAGFTLASLDIAAPDRVRATIQSAKAGAVAGWLARLEARGVLVDTATLTDKGDRTVGVTLVLKARGA